MIIKQLSFDLDVSVRNTNIGTIKQNNTNSIKFVINMVDGGSPVDLSGVTYAMISIKRPNGSVSNSVATVENSLVSYLLEPNAVNLTGLYEAEIQLFASGDSLLISSTFYYNIQESLYSDGSVTSQPEYPILVQLISDVTAMKDGLAPIAADEATRKANEIARVSNESSRVASETARVSAESTRATNESTRQTNETGRVSAESTRVTQENTRQSNETARVSAESSRVTAENNRASNESIRNQGFVTAMGEESERIDNENARILSENGRQSAESIRVTSENARISAESSRSSAEITRAANEIIREQFEFKGNYDAGTGYVVNNVVSYNGSSYICIANSTGNLPTNSTYWKMVAQKGLDGTGSGDMNTDVYDQNNNGIVDDSEKLGGQLPAYYTDILARLGFTPLDASYYTAADVLAKLLTVDGTGSGLDADTLDGKHISSFVSKGIGYLSGDILDMPTDSMQIVGNTVTGLPVADWFMGTRKDFNTDTVEITLYQMNAPYTVYKKIKANGSWVSAWQKQHNNLNQLIKGTLTTDTTNWVASGDGRFPYVKSITIAGLTTSDKVNVDFQLASYATAETANISVTETATDTLKLYAKSIPAASVTFDYTIIKG